jgi:hypothetical protein
MAGGLEKKGEKGIFDWKKYLPPLAYKHTQKKKENQ